MEFKQDELFFEKNIDYIPDNNSLMETKEISLVLNEENQYRKYNLMSSGSVKMNIMRLVLTVISFILTVNVIPCDQINCLILSGVGLFLVLCYNGVSLYHEDNKIPTRKFAKQVILQPKEFVVEQYVEYQEAPKPWFDAQRQFLAYGKTKCPIDIYANINTRIELTVGVKMMDPILGEFIKLDGSDLIKLKPLSQEMEQALLFLQMINNLKETEKKKVHLIVDSIEYNYMKLPFRVFLKSKEELKSYREDMWRRSELDRIKRTQDENKRRYQENVEINERKKAEVVKLNDQINKRNIELAQDCKAQQEILDDQYLLELNNMINKVTISSKKCSLIKMVIIIINLLYSGLVFTYKTSCGSNYCGYTGLPINLIIPFELYLWYQYTTRLELSSGQENIDKNVVVRDASSNFKTKQDYLKMGFKMYWNKPKFDFFDR